MVAVKLATKIKIESLDPGILLPIEGKPQLYIFISWKTIWFSGSQIKNYW